MFIHLTAEEHVDDLMDLFKVLRKYSLELLLLLFIPYIHLHYHSHIQFTYNTCIYKGCHLSQRLLLHEQDDPLSKYDTGYLNSYIMLNVSLDDIKYR